MPTKKRVQDTHISPKQFRDLHLALLTIVGVMNRPRNDQAMVRDAGIPLDRALFPLLVGIERLGPIGVGDLAERVGRDYTTVSRQVAKLESLGLVSRQAGANDRRVTEAIVTPKGKTMTDAVDRTRERRGREIFATWSQRDFDDLVRLICRLAEEMEHHTSGA